MPHDKPAPEPAISLRGPDEPAPTSPAARPVVRTLAICGLAAVGEIALALGMGRAPGFDALLLFLVGPPAFVALITWRRRSHPARSRALLRFAAWVCGGGLAALGVLCVWARAAPQVQPGPDIGPRLVPLTQWVVVLAVWLAIARAEAVEKRAGGTNPSRRP